MRAFDNMNNNNNNNSTNYYMAHNHNALVNNNAVSSSVTPSSSASRTSRHGGHTSGVSSTQSSDGEEYAAGHGHGHGGLLRTPAATAPPLPPRFRGNTDSFTILAPPQNPRDLVNSNVALAIPPPDSAPPTYRMTVGKRNHRNLAFSIMAEVPPRSRSPSPPGGSGRVSPFRGRGFRTGASSRHTTPAPSPPPNSAHLAPAHSGMDLLGRDDLRSTVKNISYISSTSEANFTSKIPMPIRTRSNRAISPVHSNPSSATRRPILTKTLSRSLSNLSSNPTILRPPASPRRNSSGRPLFSQLSPIIGTPTASPETKSILKPSKSAFTLLPLDTSIANTNHLPSTSVHDPFNGTEPKTPSKIPRSTSFHRLSQSTDNLARQGNGMPSRSNTNLTSREPSPSGKPPRGPSRASSRNTSPVKRGSNSRTASPTRNNMAVHKHISRTQSVKHLTKPHSVVPSRATSPANTTNPTTTTKETNPSNGNSNANNKRPPRNLAAKPPSRGPSPNRLNVPKPKTGTGTKSREPSPNRTSTKSPKSPTKIPQKLPNPTKKPISKTDSQSKLRSNSRPKPPPKPKSNKSDEKPGDSKPTGSRITRQMSKDRTSLKLDSASKSDSRTNLLTKTPSSRQLITEESPMEEHTAEDTPKDQASASNAKSTPPEDNDSPPVPEPEEPKPSVLAETIQATANNVVSATTETVTAPLNIEPPKPQVPPSRSENLLAKNVSDMKPNATDSARPPKPMQKSLSRARLISETAGKIAEQKSQAVRTVEATIAEDPVVPPAAVKNQSVMTPAANVNAQVGGATTLTTVDNSASNRASGHNATDVKVMQMNTRNNNASTPNYNDRNSVTSSNGSVRSNNVMNKDKVVIVSEKVKPIQIQVKERGMNLDVQSGNISMNHSPSNGVLGSRPRISSTNGRNDLDRLQPADSTTDNAKPSLCYRIFPCCKKPCCSSCRRKKSEIPDPPMLDDPPASKGCFSCCCRKSGEPNVTSETSRQSQKFSDASNRSAESEPKTCFRKVRDVICCAKKNKVGDMQGTSQGCCGRLRCCGKNREGSNWAERRDSILSDEPPKRCCPKLSCCRRKSVSIEPEPDSRRTSMLDKKKSLTPTVQPEKKPPSIDESLVEHTSQMKGAIPILPVSLAWFCLIMNCLLPGTGTIISGFLCLCFGKPRFSVYDGARLRVGAFIIDLIIGISQLFTVLFCLVGWGWSIWWGVIMLRVARKHKKFKMAQRNDVDERPVVVTQNHNGPDVERGRT